MSRRPARADAMMPVLLLGAGMMLPTLAWAAASADAPLLRRSVVAVLGLLGAFALSLRGWHRFERRRRWQGVGLVCCGGLLGVGALSLLRLSECPQTWHWWL